MGVRRRGAKRAAHSGVRLQKLRPRGGPSSTQDRSEEDGNGDDADPAARVQAALADMRLETAAFAYESIPDELLTGTDLDLSVWSVVADDACLKRLEAQSHRRGRASRQTREAVGLEPSPDATWATTSPASNQAADAVSFLRRTPPMSSPRAIATAPVTVQTLNLSGARNITDHGLAAIARACPQLRALNVEKAAQLSDLGVRALVIACRHLERLVLSHIPGLQGVALTTIVEVGLPLRELAIAGCVNVPEFALRRLLLACPTLEALDLSLCAAAVTDGLFLGLAQASTVSRCRLQSLRLRGCRQLSDAGAVHIATACPDLALLDLTRLDLAYKLNDIALLSLAEHCRALQTLHLRGCEMISDVGLSWLASGCAALSDVDLTGCTRVTDLGLRAIGEGLLQLRHLRLGHSARVSDLGLRHLARGCPELTHLDLTGLPLLSDAHTPPPSAATTTPTMGPRDALPSEIGVAALARHCPRLRYLELTRCTAIGDRTLQSVGRDAQDLVVLHLTGCSRVTSLGVRRVLAGCGQLTTLTLSDCVLVDDGAFLPTAEHPSAVPHRLTSLRLGRCAGITDRTLEALARARLGLRELELSGCGRITDVGLLALAESSSGPTLRSLWLRELPAITETALSWLAERCPRLLLLDLTATPRIRSFSLHALGSAWRFGHVVPGGSGNASGGPGVGGFKGLSPIHRAEDRLFIEEYGDCWHAAIRIQCLYRARVARRIARARREEQLIIWVATRLQSVFRGRQARRRAVLRRLEFRTETEAARRIQGLYRQRQSRALAAKLRDERRRAAIDRAARQIQLAWRRRRLRERILSRTQRRLAWERRRALAATKLQRLWRGRQARTRVNVLRAARELREREEADAANRMQGMFRQRAARREAQRRRDEQRERSQREERAATLVQASVRRRRARQELTRRRHAEQRRQDAARRIQRRWHDKKRQVAAQVLAIGAQRRREYAAAVRLQAAWKRKKGWDEVRLLRLLREEQRQRMLAAAMRVQTQWRARRARLEVADRKRLALEVVLARLRHETRCATLIQARVRGRRGRARYRELALARKRRWKPIVHPDTGQQFYYNTETGEVRYRRPQDVLDLLPQPPCDNCVAPEPIARAEMECRDCGEVYCLPCWGHVHAGGRRKGHAFRALYDYYGKRIDYGDGEFPSRWPSELQQDELDGWSLRTYPTRAPVETDGSWERYVDAPSGREWFYNKLTHENSYVRPEGAQLSSLTSAADDALGGWAPYVDPATGGTYYYHAATGASSYDRPSGAGSGSGGGTRGSWGKFYDSRAAQFYYFDTETQVSTLSRPPAFATPRGTRGPEGLFDVFVDPVTGRAYTYDPTTTECRALGDGGGGA